MARSGHPEAEETAPHVVQSHKLRARLRFFATSKGPNVIHVRCISDTVPSASNLQQQEEAETEDLGRMVPESIYHAAE